MMTMMMMMMMMIKIIIIMMIIMINIFMGNKNVHGYTVATQAVGTTMCRRQSFPKFK